MHVATVVLVLVDVLLVLLNVVETTAVAVAAVRHHVRIAAIDVVHHPIRVPEVVIVDVIREEGKDSFLLSSISFSPSVIVVCCSLSSLLLLMFLFLFLGTYTTRAYLKLASLFFIITSCLSKEKDKRVEGKNGHIHITHYTHTFTRMKQGTQDIFPFFQATCDIYAS